MFAIIIYVLVLLLVFASMWKVFTKAGKPGWAILVPIYNMIILLEIAGKPWWWIFLFMIPGVNFVVMIIVYLEIAKAFGKSSGFAMGLLFFGFIFFPMLAFGDAEYIGTGE